MRTSQAHWSSAEICRQNSWVPGTLLEGPAVSDDGQHQVTVQIRITAVGERSILARPYAIGGVVLHNAADEAIYDLHSRDWEAV